MERAKLMDEGKVTIMEELGHTVCDRICTKLEGMDESEAEDICSSCPFDEKFKELYAIVRQLDMEYLEICRENGRIKRRLELYDLYSDMS